MKKKMKKVDFGMVFPARVSREGREFEANVTLGNFVKQSLDRTRTFKEALDNKSLIEKSSAENVQELTEDEFKKFYMVAVNTSTIQKLAIEESLTALGNSISEYEETLKK